ncbi:hypothetical protein KCP69_25740 [Salmonella enterica subsp. enterica]|nr:hypothetical protein KCP69_25740 [Salmonella enterica subsp. enterica]
MVPPIKRKKVQHDRPLSPCYAQYCGHRRSADQHRCDIPLICTLLCSAQVKSRILYEQMSASVPSGKPALRFSTAWIFSSRWKAPTRRLYSARWSCVLVNEITGLRNLQNYRSGWPQFC